MYQTDSESNPRVWKILAGVLVVAILLISVWSCNANRDQRLAAEKVIEQQDAEITRLGGEVDKANRIIRDANAEIERLGGEVDKANRIIRDANAEIERLSGEMDKANRIIRDANAEIERLSGEADKANRIIQRQNVALECYAKKSNDTELLSFVASFVANTILPGAGNVLGSVLDQQQKC